MRFLYALPLIALCSCSQLDAKVGMDLDAVNALANKMNDQPVVACTSKLGMILGEKPPGADLLYKAYSLYLTRQAFGPNGECQGVTAEIAVEAFSHFVPTP